MDGQVVEGRRAAAHAAAHAVRLGIDMPITAALKEIWEGQSKGDNVPLQKYSDDEEVMFVMARLSKLQMIADNFGAAVTFN